MAYDWQGAWPSMETARRSAEAAQKGSSRQKSRLGLVLGTACAGLYFLLFICALMTAPREFQIAIAALIVWFFGAVFVARYRERRRAELTAMIRQIIASTKADNH